MDQRRVLALVDGGKNPVVVLAHHDHLCDLGRGEVGQPQLDELALLVQVIASAQGGLEGRGPVRGVEVEDVNAVGAELIERFLAGGDHLLGSVVALVGRVAFGRQLQATLFPACFAGEGFLLAIDIAAGRVDLVESLGLEVVKYLLVLVDVGYAVGVGGLIRTVISISSPKVNRAVSSTYPNSIRPKMTRGFELLATTDILAVSGSQLDCRAVI